MTSEFGQSKSVPHQNPFCFNNSDDTNNDAGNFECNICFELAQDPIITLCGHLFCWPCLYKWLRHHSHYQECPVCKALVQEEKLVPLYGRGKMSSDPRLKIYPGIDIPSHPYGQWPETTPPPIARNFANYGFRYAEDFMPMATSRIGNFTLATTFGGLISSLFNIHFHGFPDATLYGTTFGFPHAFSAYRGGHARNFSQPPSRRWHADSVLKNFLLLIGISVILALL